MLETRYANTTSFTTVQRSNAEFGTKKFRILRTIRYEYPKIRYCAAQNPPRRRPANILTCSFAVCDVTLPRNTRLWAERGLTGNSFQRAGSQKGFAFGSLSQCRNRSVIASQSCEKK